MTEICVKIGRTTIRLGMEARNLRMHVIAGIPFLG
jgi:hypothetical protein